jgi:hypothetical protein
MENIIEEPPKSRKQLTAQCSKGMSRLNIFEKLELISYFRREQFPVCTLYRRKHGRVLLRRISSDVHSALIQHIEQLKTQGYQLIVELLREDIPGEYIGIERLYHGKKLVSQTYLKQQSVRVEKTFADLKLIPFPETDNRPPIH